MIGVRLMDRLGNHLFQYAAARGVAQLHDTGVAVMGVPTRLGALRLRGDTVFSDDATEFARGREELRETNGFAFDPAILNAPDGTMLAGYFQSECYFAPIADSLRDEFQLARPLEGDESRVADQMRSDESIALHVRRGDYVTDARARRGHGLLGTRYYRNALRVLASRGVRGPVFGFSDDPQWCRSHLDLGAPTTWLPANSQAPERDLHLMASCRHHVIANSSFSWWGAWLAEPADQIVIAPEKWFDGYRLDTRDLIPSRWLRVANPPTFDMAGAKRVVRSALRPLGLVDAEGALGRRS